MILLMQILLFEIEGLPTNYISWQRLYLRPTDHTADLQPLIIPEL